MTRNLTIALLLIFSVLPGSGVAEMSAGPEGFTVPSPFDVEEDRPRCPFEQQGDLADLTPVIELMKDGPDVAMACVGFLDERFPEWERADNAQSLVGPFVAYLLDSGANRGLQRHGIFVELLGPLQTIAPDWRRRDEVDERLADVMLGSVVEDPFVANFWRETLQEADLEWQTSDAAKSVQPELYELAFQQAQRPADRRNERPKDLLRELSWIQHTRLVLATQVFDTWPKRLLWATLALVMVTLILKYFRRRKEA